MTLTESRRNTTTSEVMLSHYKQSGVFCIVCLAVLMPWSGRPAAQNTSTTVPPVIDVHVHAMDDSFPGIGPMCPNTPGFTASDPSTKEAPFGWVQEECTAEALPLGERRIHQGRRRRDAAAQRHGGGLRRSQERPEVADAAPARVIPGTSFNEGPSAGAARPAR